MKELPEGWSLTTLGQLGRYQNGRGFKSSEWGTTGRPIIRIQNLTGSGKDFNYFDGVVEEKYVVRKGDLLVSWAATLGAYFWDGPDGLLNQHIFRVESNIDKRFHKYLIETKIAEMLSQTHGSGMVHITKGKFDAIPVALPPLDEQRRIVAILEDHLSRLDAGTQSLNGVLARLEAYRLTLRGSAMTGGVGDAVSDPAAWPKLTLDDLQAEGPSSITDGPFGSNLKSSHYTLEGARVIRLQNVGLGEFLNAEAYISLSHFDGLRKHEAIQGDLIVASLGDVLPRVCLLPDLGQPAIVKADCIRIRLGGRVRPQWVLMSMLTPQARRWAKEQLHGVGRMRLGLKAIRGFTLPVPDLDTQDSILSAVDEQLRGASRVEEAARRALRFKDATRRSLLVAAFSGQLTKESLNV
jgi:type I restriction enzyme S subunit